MTRLTSHLVRGGTAAALILFALDYAETQPAFAVIAGIMAVVAMRGCPACWAFGLWDSIRHQ
jgi:hypothetical protein